MNVGTSCSCGLGRYRARVVLFSSTGWKELLITSVTNTSTNVSQNKRPRIPHFFRKRKTWISHFRCRKKKLLFRPFWQPKILKVVQYLIVLDKKAMSKRAVIKVCGIMRHASRGEFFIHTMSVTHQKIANTHWKAVETHLRLVFQLLFSFFQVFPCVSTKQLDYEHRNRKRIIFLL